MFEVIKPAQVKVGDLIRTGGIEIKVTSCGIEDAKVYGQGPNGARGWYTGTVIDSPWTYGVGALGSEFTGAGNDLASVARRVVLL